MNTEDTEIQPAHRAAIRFEGALARVTPDALIRCYDLIRRCCVIEAVTGLVDAYPVKMKEITINTSAAFIHRRLGQDISDSEIIRILTSLDFDVTGDASALSVKVPHYRATKDVSIPEDIVEEVGRIFGYDNIAPRSPMVACEAPGRNLFRLFERKNKEILASYHGMTEISGYSFTGEDILNRLGINEDRELRLSNPLSQEQDRLRRTLAPNIISNVRLNQRHQDEFRIFEQNRVYLKENRKSPELIAEKTFACGAVFARSAASTLLRAGIIMDMLEKHRVKAWEMVPAAENIPQYAHPGRSLAVMIDGKQAGLVFELHPKIVKDFEIAGQSAFFDIELDAVFAAKKSPQSFTDLQKFPPVPFEISVIADSNTYAGEICSIIRESESRTITSVEVISVYQGNPIPEGKKSVSIRIVFEAKDRTLSPNEIDSMQKKVIKALEKKGFTLR